ncbi:MAG: OsmC family protein [Rubrobacteraceae bacterium]
MSQDKDHVTIKIGKGFYTEITANGHTMVADEPASVGGTDEGPDPYYYLMGALGSCTAMTLRMYADRKGWPLESATVRLKHGKIYAEDCGNCETETGKIDHIEREIEIEGDDLSDEQREKLLGIADKCPVHRTLTSETVIEDRTPARS